MPLNSTENSLFKEDGLKVWEWKRKYECLQVLGKRQTRTVCNSILPISISKFQSLYYDYFNVILRDTGWGYPETMYHLCTMPCLLPKSMKPYQANLLAYKYGKVKIPDSTILLTRIGCCWLWLSGLGRTKPCRAHQEFISLGSSSKYFVQLVQEAGQFWVSTFC